MKRETQETFNALLRKHLTKVQALGKASLPCPDENTVVAYTEGSLPENLKQDFEKHAAFCSRCQQELALFLKTQKGPEFVSSLPLPSAGSRGNWRMSILGGFERLRHWGLKPALAIFIVTLISGFLGYELLLEHHLDKASSSRLAKTASPNRPAAMEESNSALTPEAEREQREQESSAARGRDEKTTAVSSRFTSNKKSAVSNSPVPVPPVTLSDTPKGRNERTALRENRAIQSRRDEADRMATANSDLEAHQKERPKAEPPLFPPSIRTPAESSEQKSGAITVPNQKRSSSPSFGAIGEASREAQSDTRAASSSKIQGARAETKKDMDRLRKAKIAGRPVGETPQKQDKPEAARASNALPVAELLNANQFSRLEVAGKTFELRNNVWTDSSIDENEKLAPTLVYKNSPRYRDQMKALSAYQTVLSRPEDCLIKYEGKIYLAKNSPSE
jgi:hypothetical protein